MKTAKLGLAALALLAAPALAQPRTDTGGGDAPGAGGVRPLVSKTGEEVYRNVCQACHMADGKGGDGAGRIPALASNPRLAQPAYPIVMIAKGRGAMPWFNDTLSPDQVAQVTNYIRTHFGNAYKGTTTADDVTKIGGQFYTHSRDRH